MLIQILIHTGVVELFIKTLHWKNEQLQLFLSSLARCSLYSNNVPIDRQSSIVFISVSLLLLSETDCALVLRASHRKWDLQFKPDTLQLISNKVYNTMLCVTILYKTNQWSAYRWRRLGVI